MVTSRDRQPAALPGLGVVFFFLGFSMDVVLGDSSTAMALLGSRKREQQAPRSEAEGGQRQRWTLRGEWAGFAKRKRTRRGRGGG